MSAVLTTRGPLSGVRELDLRITGRTVAFPWCATVAAWAEVPAADPPRRRRSRRRREFGPRRGRA